MDQDIEKDVQVEVFDAEDIYWSLYTQQAPDIIFTIDNWRCIVKERQFNDVLFKMIPTPIDILGHIE